MTEEKDTHKAQGNVEGGPTGQQQMDTEEMLDKEIQSFKQNYLAQVGIDPDVVDEYLDYEDYVKFIVQGMYTQYVMEMIEQQRKQAQQNQQMNANVANQAQQVKQEINQGPEQL